MAKKDKVSRKRAQRRERAKLRAEGLLPEEVTSQEEAADEAVEQADKATAPEPRPRAKKAPKEEPSEGAFDRLKSFFREVDIERKKINWPATDDTWKSTWVTVIFIVALSVFMGFASLGFNKVSDYLFGAHNFTDTATPVQQVPDGGDVEIPPADDGSGTPAAPLDPAGIPGGTGESE